MAKQQQYLFQRVAKSARNLKIHELPADEARTWFRNMASNVSYANPKKIQSAAQPFQNIVNLSANSLGKMYMFDYEAKYAKQLPYWDRFPLIFPIEFYGSSILGINLHYLPPYLRAKLMDALYETINNDKYDKTTKCVISYSILSSATKFRYFRPCIHKYLHSNVRSPFLYVAPQLWDYSLMLPTSRFQKMGEERVWADSLSKL